MTDPTTAVAATALRVFVYRVELCREDGSKGSGWGVEVVTDSQDPSDLLRIARVHFAQSGSIGSMEDWTGLAKAELLLTAVLDPRIA